MKLHIQTTWFSLLIVILSFFLIIASPNWCTCGVVVQNISVGLFSSSLLLMISSMINYCSESDRLYREFYWKLIELEHKALVLSTIPKGEELTSYWSALADINSLITGYFAVCDQNYVFPFRKKVQKVFQIHSALKKYSRESLDAEIHIRTYLGKKVTHDGEPLYSFKQLEQDILPFLKETDDFMDTGEPFVCYLNKKILELAPYIEK